MKLAIVQEDVGSTPVIGKAARQWNLLQHLFSNETPDFAQRFAAQRTITESLVTLFAEDVTVLALIDRGRVRHLGADGAFQSVRQLRHWQRLSSAKFARHLYTENSLGNFCIFFY